MNKYMKKALEEAIKSGEDIPVGAIVVKDGKVISAAHNEVMDKKDPTMHAEIIAIRKAAEALNNHNLSGCTIYTTLEPCPMCSGAIINSKFECLVYGACDMEFGAAGSKYNLFNDVRAKGIQVYGGILEKECSEALHIFFKELRKK